MRNDEQRYLLAEALMYWKFGWYFEAYDCLRDVAKSIDAPLDEVSTSNRRQPKRRKEFTGDAKAQQQLYE